MVRLKDIADELGLSVPVVSRVLNPKPDKHAVIAETTRKTVLETAEKMGYRRNRSAEFLARGGKSAAIGVFLPDVGNSLTAELMIGISEGSQQHGFPVSFFFGFGDRCYLEFMSRISSNSGMITYPNPVNRALLKSEVDKYLAVGGKVVFIAPYNYDFVHEDLPVIGIDDDFGGALAARRLLERGCGRLIGCHAGGEFAGGPRGRGFANALREAGVVAETTGVEVMETELAAYRPKPGAPPLGIFAHSDEIALRLMRQAFRSGLKVGSEVLLVGYDDLYLTDKLPVALTTIRQPFRELGKRVFDAVVAQLYDRKVESARLKPLLIGRESA